MNSWAQTYGAQQAVRQRVQGLDGREEALREVPDEAPPAAEHESTVPRDPAAARIDTRFVTGGAVAVIVVRPAQIMSTPLAELLPTEVATAAGLKYAGIDPAGVDELVGFFDMSNPSAPPAYGLTVKFNQPFRGASIPPERRAHAQLAELAGKKYLQSAHPMLPSFFGPNNRTLMVGPDATLRQLIESNGQSKTGPMIDRLREVPAGNDLYMAFDVASLRPFIQMGLAQAASQVPPEAQQFLKVPELVSAVELTVNLSAAGPTSLVVHANDETAAGELESLIANSMNQYQEKMRTSFAEQAASADPVQQAMSRYMERLSSRWNEQMRPQRNGPSLTFFHPEAQDPSKKQLMGIAAMGMMAGLLTPAIQAARKAAQQQPPQSSEPTEPPTEAEPGL
ncbi:MAG: hypothetical protein WD229_07970 [Pirellulales bacterium]